MLKRLAIFSLVFLLNGCAFIQERSIQDITVETPGARNALCYAYVDGLKHKISPPQTIEIAKSKEDLVIYCLAPVNRRREVVIHPEDTHTIYGNAATGFLPGMALDALSGASWRYPAFVQVDFTGAPLVPEALPPHNSPDIRQPEDYDLEEFRPGTMRLNSDRYAEPVTIKRREMMSEINDDAEQDLAPLPDKGDLMDVMSHMFDDDTVNVIEPAAGEPDTVLPAYPGD